MVTVLSTSDPAQIEHHQTLDALNRYIEEKELPLPLSFRLRRYFISLKMMAKQNTNQALLDKLSPKLREDVSHSTAAWLRGVPYLDSREVSIGFLVSVSSVLTEAMFEARENIPWNDSLNLVSRGVASTEGRVCPAGTIWGDDFVMQSAGLKDRRPHSALTYCTVVNLTRARFYAELRESPVEARVVRKAAVQLATRRALLAYACALAASKQDLFKFNFSALTRRVAKSQMLALFPAKALPAPMLAQIQAAEKTRKEGVRRLSQSPNISPASQPDGKPLEKRQSEFFEKQGRSGGGSAGWDSILDAGTADLPVVWDADMDAETHETTR